ncbi:Ribose ABC transport system, ATP-binding protein RbsA [Paenibacillus pasadenensis]|uniref:Ribose ABC transport system, ATP-binding protein RbsA n=2 Tax=Paenibacillus TaxID=44249 RepID=A0A2N5N541_9BACL|nr:Ribose ABC transport system, ATP-binding protein RbsA [Paenibacillus pasadenensis]
MVKSLTELLRMNGIVKSFPGVKALSGVDLELQSGELHALIGENGAGKSTLMKILAGVYKKDEGRIFIKGEEVVDLDPDSAQKRGISIIFQEFNLFSDLTIAENIFIRREPKHALFNFVIDDRELKRKTREVLDMLDLKLDPDQQVGRLSVAEQQMVEIAKALSMDAQILVMDEPTAALTESEIKELFKVIRNLKKNGVGIIYISHRLEELNEICDRVTILRDGSYIKTERFQDMTMNSLISSMVGRDLSEKFPPKPHTKADRSEVLLQVNKIRRGTKLDVEDLKLYKGEILGIYGLMGSGRTELARAIFGADRVDQFDVRIFGEPMKVRAPYDAIAYGLAYLTEDRKKDGLALDLSIEYNITLPSLEKITSVGVVSDRKAALTSEKYVQDLRVKTPSIHQLAKNLSGGNQQKVIIGKWLAKQSRIVIFDEPTRGIDVGAKYEVYELMYRLVQEGIGVIMISSELPEIIGISDRVVIMREGRVTGELDAEDLTEVGILSHAIH